MIIASLFDRSVEIKMLGKDTEGHYSYCALLCYEVINLLVSGKGIYIGRQIFFI